MPDSDNPQIKQMALQFSKLNFKAKNQASTLSIHEPFAQKFMRDNITQ